MNRREFLKTAAGIAAMAGLGGTQVKALARGLEQVFSRQTRIAWLQGQSCSGCSISFLNADNPTIQGVVTRLTSLMFHQNLSAAQGQVAMNVLDQLAREKDFILLVEGSIPLGMPEACTIGGRPFAEILDPLARQARYVMGVGTCATYGGLPAAEGNATGAASVKAFLESRGIKTDRFLVNCPTCPAHPDSVIGTILYLAGEGYPAVDPVLLTPDMFYKHSTHDGCPRFHYYSKHIFAEHFGDQEGCLFKLGCLGMLSHTECPRRQWNNAVNWCIRASAPCIGCSHPQFGKSKAFPLYRKCEAARTVEYREEDRKGA